jgi:hypothetical protein
MCGPGIGTRHINFIRTLAYVSGLRGTHGTGVFQGKATKKLADYTLAKSAQEVSYFMWFHENDADKGDPKILNDIFTNFMMGHVRYATKGGVNDKNAHPFDVGRYVGAHNGTLYDKKYEDKTKTDSEMMFHDINERSFGPVLRDLNEGSAYAISMFDKQNKELVFARNDKRTLNYAWDTESRTLVWASERIMLEFAALRSNIKLSTVCSFTPGTIYCLRPEDVGHNRMPDWRVRPVHPLSQDTPRTNRETLLDSTSASSASVLAEELNRKFRSENVLPIIGPNRENVVPITHLIKKAEGVSVKKANLLIRECIHCKTKLDLYDQYLGTEIDPGVYSCKICDDMMDQLQKQKGTVH